MLAATGVITASSAAMQDEVSTWEDQRFESKLGLLNIIFLPYSGNLFSFRYAASLVQLNNGVSVAPTYALLYVEII